MKLLLFLSLTMFGLTNASAGECLVKYERTACKGQEKISYKKCGGEKICVKKKRAKSKEDCQKAALKSCRNSRLDITKLKVITATYDGVAITSASGKSDFCQDYANKGSEFNQCE